MKFWIHKHIEIFALEVDRTFKGKKLIIIEPKSRISVSRKPKIKYFSKYDMLQWDEISEKDIPADVVAQLKSRLPKDKLLEQFKRFEKDNKHLYENLYFVSLIAEDKDVEVLKGKILESKNDPKAFLFLLNEVSLVSYYNKVADYMGWKSEFDLLTEGEYPTGDGYEDQGYVPNEFERYGDQEDHTGNGNVPFEFPLFWIFTDSNNKTTMVKFKDEREIKDNLDNYPENRQGFKTEPEANKEFIKRGGKA
jgi:hypothetical protein